MHRISLLSFVFVLLLMTCASAEIYRCRTVAGELFMTDQKTNFPADCKPVDEPVGHGSFSIEPVVKVDKAKSPSAPPEQASTPGVTDGQDGQRQTGCQGSVNGFPCRDGVRSGSYSVHQFLREGVISSLTRIHST